jgi:NAD+ synthase
MKKMKNFLQNDEEIIEEICKFIKTEIELSRTNGTIIGISGGIDSALVAYLAVKAIGKDKVCLAHLPETALNPEHSQDAEIIAKNLNVPLRTIDISTILESYIQLLPNLETNRLAKGNLKARIRAVIFYSIANLENRLVIGASNKSEIMIGYGTKYGDLAADIWPIADLYKTEVVKLSKTLGINEKIILKPPTAGLWPNQTDEGEIGINYNKLDKLLLAIENIETIDNIKEKLQLDQNKIDHIKNMIEKSKHKRNLPKRFIIKRD